jgi:hypothetical protein
VVEAIRSQLPPDAGWRTPASPPRVIDELMGHQRSRHGELDGGSRIGARYRHTTDEMAARVVEAVEARLESSCGWPRK